MRLVPLKQLVEIEIIISYFNHKCVIIIISKGGINGRTKINIGINQSNWLSFTRYILYSAEKNSEIEIKNIFPM